MGRPQPIVWFERCYLGAVALGLANSAMNWSAIEAQIAATPNSQLLPDWFAPVTMAVGVAVNVLLWFLVARRGSVVAKWIVAVFFALAVLGLVRSVTGGTVPATFNPLSIIALGLQAVAVWMLFRPDAKPWFER